jgi:AcrR family transcriptional regulator
MARPQSPDYDKRRDAIVAVAAGLYARNGFKGASVADLASACRTSKSLIYHYFPSKEDILYDVMASHLELLADAAEEAVGGEGGDPKQRLQAIAHSFMRLYSGAADRHRVLLNELDNLPSERRADVIAKQRRIIALVESQIRQVRPDLAGAAKARALTMLFFGMINWTHTWFKADGEMPAEALGDLAVELMLNGLAGLEPQAS